MCPAKPYRLPGEKWLLRTTRFDVPGMNQPVISTPSAVVKVTSS